MKAIWNVIGQNSQNQSSQKVVAAFKGGRLLIGRSTGELILEDKFSSRKHCALYVTQKGEFLILDLGSRNGTRLNGQKIRSEKMKIGDEIAIGETRLILLEVVSDSARLPLSPAAPISHSETVKFTLKLKTHSQQPQIVFGSDALYTCCSDDQKEGLVEQGLIKKR